MLIPNDLAQDAARMLLLGNDTYSPVKTNVTPLAGQETTFCDPTRNAFPVRMEDSERAQIRALWWWRNYLYNVRAQLGICNRITANGKRKIARLAIEQARAGALPSVYGLALHIRIAAKTAGVTMIEWVNGE